MTRIIVSLPGKSLSDSKDYLPEDVVEYLGVRPDQVVDYKALVGDKSDNIPGVAGIGEKTAASLLKNTTTWMGYMPIWMSCQPASRRSWKPGAKMR